ncbi:hypothetical protein EI94DRAFT_1705706 [Lactarius quietus]|nr:hypothetical protein EI94DRAFT_1705706 [Lactarius quietus]
MITNYTTQYYSHTIYHICLLLCLARKRGVHHPQALTKVQVPQQLGLSNNGGVHGHYAQQACAWGILFGTMDTELRNTCMAYIDVQDLYADLKCKTILLWYLQHNHWSCLAWWYRAQQDGSMFDALACEGHWISIESCGYQVYWLANKITDIEWNVYFAVANTCPAGTGVAIPSILAIFTPRHLCLGLFLRSYSLMSLSLRRNSNNAPCKFTSHCVSFLEVVSLSQASDPVVPKGVSVPDGFGAKNDK